MLYRFAPAAAAVLVAIVLPIAGTPYLIDVGTLVLVYVILGLGLNVVVGYAGLLDLGYAAFFAIGAYTTALLMVDYHWPFWVTLPVAALLTALSGIIIGTPTLRLRSDYLAIVTLGFGEIVRIAATNLTFTGGPEGVYGIPHPRIGMFVLRSPQAMYVLAMAFALLVLVGSYNLARSRLGRAWLAIREDEAAAQAAGIYPVYFKLMAYVLGAVFAGAAGSFFAVKLTAINPSSFTFIQSVTILMVIILGGMGSLPGVILGAAVIVMLPEALRAFDQVRMFAFGIGLIALMLIRPQGLWPSRIGQIERRVVAASAASIAAGTGADTVASTE
ncbi:MAG: branched-chain amino acid ABC transporter permease [Bacillati bacterium ANGP1]|uniref:Branched-chain amino acid ABC transporter permease n=1 Tax=Candidatus Segetimicrobium genomatis TaxID=2569760 RepID=A0A537J9B4_9BACT|nr:MAG: branched-chain amino acid ABC transporter permease [Terrabacteria group bacterium ANGP1]